jgi:hypothetical protein
MDNTSGGENLLDKKMGTSLLRASAKASSPHGYQSTFTSNSDSVTNFVFSFFLGNSRNSTQFNPIIPVWFLRIPRKRGEKQVFYLKRCLRFKIMETPPQESQKKPPLTKQNSLSFLTI